MFNLDPQCLEHSVCTLRNLSYRLESEIDRDRYDDADVDVDPAAVKEQQSQGCFAGCGGRKKKKVPNDRRPMDRPMGPPQGVELIWQPQTVHQYYVLLRKAKNIETLEGSAGALHNLTACSWKVTIIAFYFVTSGIMPRGTSEFTSKRFEVKMLVPYIMSNKQVVDERRKAPNQFQAGSTR